MHIRLIQNGDKRRPVAIDVTGQLEYATRTIIAGVIPYTADRVEAIRFTPIRAYLYDYAGIVFDELEFVTKERLREKLALIYPALK